MTLQDRLTKIESDLQQVQQTRAKLEQHWAQLQGQRALLVELLEEQPAQFVPDDVPQLLRQAEK